MWTMSRFDFLQCNRLLSGFYRHADEAEALYLEGRYELSAFKSRKTLDLVIQWLSQRYYGGEEQLNLKALVDGLNRQGSFSAQEYTALLTIVDIGNKAVHSEAVLSKNEANTALKSLNLFLRELNNTYKDYQSSSVQGSMEDIEAYFLSSEVEEKPVSKSDRKAKNTARAVTDIDENDPRQLLTLGQRYYKGDGVIRDMKQVVKYWTRAAELGLAEAQFALGGFYEEDYGGRQNYSLAVAWYRKAAQQGHVGAQYKLGLFLENGWGLKRDYKEARDWYAKAAGKNHAEALYRLGLIYENGYKLKADLEKAQRYFKKAAALGQLEAQAALGKYLPSEETAARKRQAPSKTDTLPRRPSAKELQEAEVLYQQGQQYFYGLEGRPEDAKAALKCYQQAADLGYAPAQEAVATCYYHGWGMKNKNYKNAVKWYTQAAEQGEAEAQYQLAECFTYGRGCRRTLETAFAWYGKAAAQKHGRAQYKLGLCYEEGRGVDQNMEEAIRWYRQAGEQQGENACTGLDEYQEKIHYVQLYEQVQQGCPPQISYQLGRCYQDGRGVSKNLGRAVALYQQAAEQGQVEAQYQLAVLYELGHGVEQDYAQAVHWYQQAANQDHEEARWKLLNWFEGSRRMDDLVHNLLHG